MRRGAGVATGGRTVDPVERELNAHEAQASATAAALLLFLWGAVSVFIVPSQFRAVDITHTIVGAVACAWFLATRRRPRPLLAYAFSGTAIADTLLVLPWITMVWCSVGRPFEAVNVPQVGMLTVALIVPRSLALGIAVLLAFLAEGLFVMLYAHHLGIQALLPVGEPALTICFAVPALGLLLLRERRRRLARRHIRLQAESDALARLNPLFADVRAELATQLAIVDTDLAGIAESPARASMARSCERLAAVDAKLGTLAEASPAAHVPQVDATRCDERMFLAADEQLGAVVFAALGAMLAIVWSPIAFHYLGRVNGINLMACGVLNALALALLLRTRRRPSQRRGRIAVIVLYVVGLVAVSINQHAYLALQRPFNPFVGHKLLMVMLGLTAASWVSLGLPLIVFAAAEALTLYYVLGFDAVKDRISVVEPWVMLVFLAISIAALLLRDQRRVTSLALLRDEAHLTALHRRAVMLLSLRDQLNTPLQTLVVDTTRVALQNPTRDVSRAQAAVARLIALSRQLAQLDVPVELQVASFADDALRGARRS
jgi:hypothetical protein